MDIGDNQLVCDAAVVLDQVEAGRESTTSLVIA
jgi:hypothetical protein